MTGLTQVLNCLKAILGAVFLFLALRWATGSIIHFCEIQNWPTASAVCTDSSSRMVGYGRNSSWVGSVSYSYGVGGKTYTAQEDLVSCVPWETEAFSKAYPKGGHFLVHYNADNSGDASLGWYGRPLLLFLILFPSTLIIGYYAIPGLSGTFASSRFKAL